MFDEGLEAIEAGVPEFLPLPQPPLGFLERFGFEAAQVRAAMLAARDEGDGLPQGFDVRKPKGLGMRIVSALTEQLNADLTVLRGGSGTEFVLTIPLAAQS